jgi:hypothetical protein
VAKSRNLFSISFVAPANYPPPPPATLAIGFMSLYEAAQLSALSSSGQGNLDTPDSMLPALIMDSIMGLATLKRATRSGQDRRLPAPGANP